MHHYDDPNYDYQAYWKFRSYEHQSEMLAIGRLLSNQHFSRIGDVGGGFGRLYPLLSQYSPRVVLLEPSLKLRNLAKKKYPQLIVKHSLSHRIPFSKNSFELITMIRVSHHLTDLNSTFKEINRVLKPGGFYLLEIANSANFKNRLQHLFRPVPKVPIEKRSQANIKRQAIDFVNHHPDTVFKLLKKHHFQVENLLSVSNFRSPLLKSFIPPNILLLLESITQKLLATFYFGPSLLILAKKAS